MQLAVIRAVINLLVLACVSGHMYHPEVWKRDEMATETSSLVTRDKRHGGDKIGSQTGNHNEEQGNASYARKLIIKLHHQCFK